MDRFIKTDDNICIPIDKINFIQIIEENRDKLSDVWSVYANVGSNHNIHLNLYENSLDFYHTKGRALRFYNILTERIKFSDADIYTADITEVLMEEYKDEDNIK